MVTPLRVRLLFATVLITLACTTARAASSAATASLAITASGSPVTSVASGTAVTLTATVSSSGSTVSPGQVMFCDATAAFCQNGSLGLAQLVTSGGVSKATMSFTPGPGTHSYKALFLGTKSYSQAASSAQSLTVTSSVATTTTLASSGSAGSYGLTAQIAGNGPYANISGTVSFLDTTTNATLGTAPVIAGFVPKFTLPTSTSIAVGNESTSVAVADFNGDGKLDVAVANSSFLTNNPADNKISVLLGNGDGTFHAAASPTVSGNWIVAGDFNNDGKVDLVVSGGASSLSLLIGNGDGTFALSSTPISTGSNPFGIASGDFNGDGNADLAVTCNNATLSILLGNGNGTFSSSSITLPGVYANSVVVADFNGDGNADVATLSYLNVSPYTNYVQLFLGKGDGTFQAGTSVSASPTSSNFMTAADFNGDGTPDLALQVGQSGVAVEVFLNNGDGTFAAPVTTTPDVGKSTDSPQPFAAADINGDGKADLAFGDFGNLNWLVSNGDGSFKTVASTVGATSGPDDYIIVTGDFNGDGVPDIFTVNSDLQVGASYITAESHGAGASLSGVAVGGSGSHTITATYGGDSAYASSTSAGVTVTATAVPTTLTLASSPTSATLGSAVALRATVSPATLGALKTDGDTVTFSNGSASLGTATLSGGVATLTTSSLPLGTNTISASFAGDTNFAAASASPATVVITAPVPAVTLSASSLTFALQNANTTSAVQTITVTNSGQAPLQVTSIAATGDFAQTNTCVTVAAGGTCMVSVTFTPTAAGSRSGILSITSNAPGSPHTVSLSGTGTPVALTAAAASLTISNPGGSATTTIQAAAVSGFSGAVSLTCAVVYQGSGTANLPPTCSLNPAQGNASSGAPLISTLTVSSTAASAALKNPAGDFGRGAGLISFAGLLFLGVLVPARERKRSLLVMLVGAAVLAVAGGCSSKSSSSKSNPGTTVGSYQVTVTANANSAATNTVVTVAVQ